MKTLVQVFAVLAVMAFVGAGYAKEKAAGEKKPAVLRGEVVRVDGTNLTVKVGKEAKEVTVATDDKTVVVIEGNTAKLSELKAGQKVVVTPAHGTATRIEVPKPRAAKGAL